MGLPAATAAFFYANRLLPTELAARADKEVLVFFIVWAIVAIAACYKSDRLAWQLTAKVNALAWAGLPVVSMLTIEGNLVSYLIHKQWVLFGFDALAIGIAVSFLVQARKLGRSQVTPAAPSRRSQREVKI